MTTDGTDLSGKAVLITGGGAGIGRGLCLHLASLGAAVVVSGRGSNIHEVVKAVKRADGEAIAVQCDVTVKAQVEEAVGRCADQFGRLDAVVHNAASGRSSTASTLEGLSDPVWSDHLAVSVRAAYYCACAAFPELRRHAGSLLFMTSPAAMEGSLSFPAYAAVKGALRGLTKSLAVEWGPMGVRVAAVSPLARTSALDKAFRENPDLEGRLASVVPLGRIGDAQADIGPAVAWLIGDGARYVTGQTLVVDGGRFMGL